MGPSFTFPTTDAAHDTVCHIVRVRPEGLLTARAPAAGIASTITARNARGLGGGVDMEPSGPCDPVHRGLNLLLLVYRRYRLLRPGKEATASVKLRELNPFARRSDPRCMSQSVR